MDARDALGNALSQLRAMGDALRQFIATSEKVFLNAGAKLHHLQVEASKLLNDASSAIAMGQSGASQSGGDPAGQLRDGLTRMDEHLARGQGTTEHGLRALAAVLTGIRNLAGLESDFQTIVATLHALASTTHLENSRRETLNAGFDTVVSDLRQMASAIKPKFNEVLEQSREVQVTAEAGLHQAKTFLDRHRRDVAHFRRETQTHLQAMTEACGTSSALAQKASRSVTVVKSSIESVLQSLQIQDIARQMIEHIVQDIDEFAAGAEKAVAPTEAEDDARAWLAELTIVTRVEAAQVNNTCDRLLSGLVQIDRALKSIVATLSSIAGDSLSFSGKNSGGSRLRLLERGIRGTSETLRAHDLQEAAMLQSLANVSATAAGVESLVDEVARFGRDARFIGLNAMVKAVHVGQAGVTLRVLAREVQEVADQIETFTAGAAKIMRSVGNDAHVLVGQPATPTPASSGHGDVAATDLETLMTELGAYQAALDTSVDSLLSGSGVLRSEVATTSNELHVLMDTIRTLRSLSTQLTKMHSDAMVAARGARPPAGRTQVQERWYTMEDERRVQRAALGHADGAEEMPKAADASSAEGSIEFF